MWPNSGHGSVLMSPSFTKPLIAEEKPCRHIQYMHNMLALENRVLIHENMNTLKRRVPLISVCADSIPYGWAYLVLSRLGKHSRLKPGMKSMGFVTSRRAPPGGTLTT